MNEVKYDRTAQCFDCKEVALGRYRMDHPEIFYCRACSEKRQATFSIKLKKAAELVRGWIEKVKNE